MGWESNPAGALLPCTGSRRKIEAVDAPLLSSPPITSRLGPLVTIASPEIGAGSFWADVRTRRRRGRACFNGTRLGDASGEPLGSEPEPPPELDHNTAP